MADTGWAGSIVVLGSINMDLVTTTSRLPKPGETLLGNTFSTVPGGKGANQAIAAAKAGGQVRFAGAVGDDDFGDRLRAALVEGGVSVDLLRKIRGPSGIASITVDDTAENTIVVVAGANGSITELLPGEQDAVRRSAMLLCQLEIPLDAVISAVGIAAAAGVPVMLNPSPARDLPAALLDGVSVLVLNEGEATAIGRDCLAQVAHVVTTLGAAGAHYRGPQENFSVSAPTVAAVDTTGAGDAFTGALAVAWNDGNDPRAALEYACAAGGLATTRAGASTSSPTAAEIDELVAATYR